MKDILSQLDERRSTARLGGGQRRIDARQFYATLPFATAVATRL